MTQNTSRIATLPFLRVFALHLDWHSLCCLDPSSPRTATATRSSFWFFRSFVQTRRQVRQDRCKKKPWKRKQNPSRLVGSKPILQLQTRVSSAPLPGTELRFGLSNPLPVLPERTRLQATSCKRVHIFVRAFGSLAIPLGPMTLRPPIARSLPFRPLTPPVQQEKCHRRVRGRRENGVERH